MGDILTCTDRPALSCAEAGKLACYSSDILVCVSLPQLELHILSLMLAAEIGAGMPREDPARRPINTSSVLQAET
jgi:hypothetical protein